MVRVALMRDGLISFTLPCLPSCFCREYINAVEVFSAVIRVKRRSHNVPVVNPMTGDVISKDSQFYKDAEIEDRLNDSYADVEVEISYPADRPYAAREIKNFRLELYNDKYNKVCLP